MKTYAFHSFKDFVLCLGYRGDYIKQYFLNYEALSNDFTMCLGCKNHITYHGQHNEQDFKVTLAETGALTMTGGRLKKIQRYIDDELFLVTYGDGLSNVDIKSLVEFHKKHGKIATVTTVKPNSRFGVAEVRNGGRVVKFHEKPQLDSWVNAGFFVLNRKVFDYIDDSEDCIFEREPLERLAQDSQLMAYRHEGFFYAMDTYREYQHLNELWASGEAPWKVWQS
jgi:glucose-1-phosphate cytidylyltransferase